MGVPGGAAGGILARPGRLYASAFDRPLEWLLSGVRWRVAACGGAALAVALALAFARQAGYPLDDSWIHQDFARTLGTAHQFAYAPGRSGAGSTSPVWVLLLTPPYILFGQAPPLVLVVGWTALLGAASLAALAMVTGAAAGELAAGAGSRTRRIASLLASFAVVTEWHLVWAAASGMETVLFCALVMATLLLAARGAPAWLLGVTVALAVAVRPEGVALAGVVGASALWAAYQRRNGLVTLVWLRVWLIRWAVPFGAVFLAGLALYLLLNLHASGRPLPSTIAAKSAYYGGAGLLQALAAYAEQVAVVLLLSSPVLVLTAVLSYSHGLQIPPRSTRDAIDRLRAPKEPRPLLQSLLIVWPILLLLGYAGRLPVLYHNGRYLMPVLPALLALGAAGAVPLLTEWRRPLARVALGLLLVAGAFSLVRGAQIYGDNVRFINACQVDTARWLSRHTAPDALIATHDIGAIGYFSHHPVVDIAGLVDPQITPYLGNQPGMESYLKSRHAAYVVEFTNWFGPPNTLLHDLGGNQVYRARGSAQFVVMRTGW